MFSRFWNLIRMYSPILHLSIEDLFPRPGCIYLLLHQFNLLVPVFLLVSISLFWSYLMFTCTASFKFIFIQNSSSSASLYSLLILPSHSGSIPSFLFRPLRGSSFLFSFNHHFQIPFYVFVQVLLLFSGIRVYFFILLYVIVLINPSCSHQRW